MYPRSPEFLKSLLEINQLKEGHNLVPQKRESFGEQNSDITLSPNYAKISKDKIEKKSKLVYETRKNIIYVDFSNVE